LRSPVGKLVNANSESVLALNVFRSDECKSVLEERLSEFILFFGAIGFSEKRGELNELCLFS